MRFVTFFLFAFCYLAFLNDTIAFVEIKGKDGQIMVKDSGVGFNNYGLTWTKEWIMAKNWSEAVYICSNLNYGDFDNWELPKLVELKTLINSNFPENPDEYFWTYDLIENSAPSATKNAMAINPVKNKYDYYEVTLELAVRCVRR